MLQITKRTDYGLIGLTHLALHPGILLSVRELAEAYGLSRPLMANVLKALGRAKLVRSVRGSRGGYELALRPEEITVGRVAEVLEGPLQLAQCVGSSRNGGTANGCSVSAACPVKHSVGRIHLIIHDVLHGQTIADLARDAQAAFAPVPAGVPASESGGEDSP